MNVRTLIRAGVSAESAERLYRSGRIAETTYIRYALAWRRSAVRYSTQWSEFGDYDSRVAELVRRALACKRAR